MLAFMFVWLVTELSHFSLHHSCMTERSCYDCTTAAIKDHNRTITESEAA